jgi:hypothetical protein
MIYLGSFYLHLKKSWLNQLGEHKLTFMALWRFWELLFVTLFSLIMNLLALLSVVDYLLWFKSPKCIWGPMGAQNGWWFWGELGTLREWREQGEMPNWEPERTMSLIVSLLPPVFHTAPRVTSIKYESNPVPHSKCSRASGLTRNEFHNLAPSPLCALIAPLDPATLVFW